MMHGALFRHKHTQKSVPRFMFQSSFCQWLHTSKTFRLRFGCGMRQMVLPTVPRVLFVTLWNSIRDFLSPIQRRQRFRVNDETDDIISVRSKISFLAIEINHERLKFLHSTSISSAKRFESGLVKRSSVEVSRLILNRSSFRSQTPPNGLPWPCSR